MIARQPNPEETPDDAGEAAPKGKKKRAATKKRGRKKRIDSPAESEEAPEAAASDDEAPAEEEAGTVADAKSAGADEAINEATAGEEETTIQLQGDDLVHCIEALLFASPEPLTRRRLYRMLRAEAPKKDIEDALIRLEADLVSSGRGYQLVEDASGLRFLSRAEFAPYVARLRGEKRRIRISQAAFETLAVIAYRQPVGRADLDTIRGVYSGAIVKRLLEWGLISIVARDEDRIGRPHLYGTTKLFLEEFGLPGLGDLPEPSQFLEFGAQSRLLIGLRDGETEDAAAPVAGDGDEESEGTADVSPEESDAAAEPSDSDSDLETPTSEEAGSGDDLEVSVSEGEPAPVGVAPEGSDEGTAGEREDE
ncbi:MAG: SMC-Scp complex subunit ScpB [Planctomycetota bacterium]